MVLESWYYTRRWSSGNPGIRGTIPRNSQLGVVGDQFPRRRQKRSWRPGITPGTGERVILEARFCTRAAGMNVVHWIPGNSRLSSSVLIPQNMATTESIPTAARGVNINGLRHLYQGSVGDGKRLEYGCVQLPRGQ